VCVEYTLDRLQSKVFLVVSIRMVRAQLLHCVLISVDCVYWVVFFQDLAISLLDNMLPVLIQSLTDASDDVRSVAALSFLPVTDALVSSLPDKVCHQHYYCSSQVQGFFDVVCAFHTCLSTFCPRLMF